MNGTRTTTTMLALLLLFALAMFMGDARAETNLTSEKCGLMSQIAGVVMKSHQQAVPMQNVMLIMQKLPGDVEVFTTLVMAAYSTPRYSTESMQNNAIREFTDSMTLMCYETIVEQLAQE